MEARLNAKKDRATIHDVAKKAGVSPATASRVLSGSDYPVSENARKRILSAAESLQYRPNLLGQMLKSSTSRDIGVILPNISNPFYSELVLGAETAAKQKGFGLLLCNTLRSELREYEYLENLCQKQVGGVILSSVASDIIPIKKLADTYRLRVVGLDQSIPEITHAKVDFHIRKGVMDAIRYLYENGHRRIALLSSPPRIFFRKEVRKGYEDGLQACGLPYREDYELFSATERELSGGEIYEFENGKLCADKLLALDPRPTAVICINDITASGLIQRLGERNVSVPDELSVIGIDNSFFARMVSPPLTSIEQSPFEAGFLVAAALIDAITENRAFTGRIDVEPRLVIRNSVKPIRTL